jgi:hypothetical protein
VPVPLSQSLLCWLAGPLCPLVSRAEAAHAALSLPRSAPLSCIVVPADHALHQRLFSGLTGEKAPPREAGRETLSTAGLLPPPTTSTTTSPSSTSTRRQLLATQGGNNGPLDKPLSYDLRFHPDTYPWLSPQQSGPSSLSSGTPPAPLAFPRAQPKYPGEAPRGVSDGFSMRRPRNATQRLFWLKCYSTEKLQISEGVESRIPFNVREPRKSEMQRSILSQPFLPAFKVGIFAFLSSSLSSFSTRTGKIQTTAPNDETAYSRAFLPQTLQSLSPVSLQQKSSETSPAFP